MYFFIFLLSFIFSSSSFVVSAASAVDLGSVVAVFPFVFLFVVTAAGAVDLGSVVAVFPFVFLFLLSLIKTGF